MTSSDRPGSVPLPSDSSAPAVARRHSSEVLKRWQLRELIEPVLLIVSELVTNAVRHGRPPVRLGLHRRDSAVRIEVHDCAPDLSGEPASGEDAESGRGLEIVRALSDAFGIEPSNESGKVAWAHVEGAGQPVNDPRREGPAG
ncbi:MAG: hypothetical protein JWO12_1946 [Frankiales bacterium]|jgi:anti-sigma regulatory factor (Ser/Thr protein kinase)|nr:hypothetical protein [Frankiales bacterium]